MKLAIGFFDGVHLGHRQILSRADLALTFAEHPLGVLTGSRAPALLMTLPARLDAIAGALRSPGPGKVRALPFTPEFASITPEDFTMWLKGEYPALDTVVCGPNWNFGAGARGNHQSLKAMGIEVEVVEFERALFRGEVISSTRIRASLAAGEVEAAEKMLGRPYSFGGKVIAGKGLGTKLGRPTINLQPDNCDLPRLLPFGVYALQTEWGRAVANWGKAPTLGVEAWERPVLEVHLLAAPSAFSPPPAMKVSLSAFIRAERKFASLEELQKQIARDVDCARALA